MTQLPGLLDTEALRKDFPILDRVLHDGRKLVYLDNAATSQTPRQVLDVLSEYYEQHNANVHRGVHVLAEEATALYEGARDKARMRLLRATKKHGIVPIGFVSAQLQPQRKLPKGVVTFLLTDIEGSTRLLHELGDSYADVLSGHRRILRRAFDDHGGQEVDTQGDSFFVAFDDPADAVAAAAASQAAVGGSAADVIAPLVFLALVMASWALRPFSRKLEAPSGAPTSVPGRIPPQGRRSTEVSAAYQLATQTR